MHFHRRSVLTISLLLSSSTLSQAQPFNAGPTPTPGQPSRQAAASAYGRLALNFVKNQGQFDERARFVARQGGVTAYCTRDGFVLQLVAGERDDQQGCLEEENGVAGANVFFTFEGASRETRVQGREELPGRFHYLRGEDPAQWHTDVPAYQKIHYQELYPGIDLELSEGETGCLEYDLIFRPGAVLDSVRVHCEGGTSLSLDDQGALVLQTAAGPLKQPRPLTYQIGPSGERIAVDCSFRIVDQTHFGFEARCWDPQAPLVIDPGLVYSTFLGGTGRERYPAIAVDSTGAAYAAGWTSSSGFPTTPGAFDTSLNGFDAFVTKLDASGSMLVYSTFLGGTDGEYGDAAQAIVVDNTGAAYVAGRTNAPDFPTTPGAFNTSHNGNADAFVTKLDASGSALVYSTFLGGMSYDVAVDMTVDSAGAAYVTGTSYSSDFPTTPGAFDTSFNGTAFLSEAFVTKLDASGGALVYSTFLGATKNDGASAIAVDGAGAAYVAGSTESSDFPTTPGAFDTSFNSLTDAFVTKLHASGSALVNSTFLGGTRYDNAFAIAVDSAGAAYVVGSTDSSGFPATPGAFDTSYNGGNSDAFVTKLDASGSALVYSTFLGGGGFDQEAAIAIAVEGAGTAYVAGLTGSVDFPTTPGAFDTSWNGGSSDAFVAKLDASGSALVYSTYLGGTNDDRAYALAMAPPGAVVIAGETVSSGFPTTPGAFDTSHNGLFDVFVTKLTIDCPPAGWSNYGAGWPGTLGIPSFLSGANPSLGSTITLSIGNSLGANTIGFLAIGLTQASLGTVYGGTLLLLPMTIVTISIPAPGLSVPGPIPNDTSLCGLAVFLQVMEIDAGASKGVSFTPGLALDIGI